MKSTLYLVLVSVITANAFAPPKAFPNQPSITHPRQGIPLSETASKENDVDDEPAMNLENPVLPKLKGDFDWDAKFGGDADWITENVPGKIVLNEVELARQVTALTQLEEKWRKERLQAEYEENKKVGFVQNAELLNSRFAMFFLVTGLLTEYWTGVSLPGQVEEMLRIVGFIGFD